MEYVTQFLDDVSDALENSCSLGETMGVLRQKTMTRIKDFTISNKETIYKYGIQVPFGTRLMAMCVETRCDKHDVSSSSQRESDASSSQREHDAVDKTSGSTIRERDARYLFAYFIDNFDRSDRGILVLPTLTKEEKMVYNLAMENLHEEENPAGTPQIDILTSAFLKYAAQSKKKETIAVSN